MLFGVDPAFTESERLEIAAASEDVRSEGISILLVVGRGEGSVVRGRPHFRSIPPDAPGAFSHELFSIWIVPDAPDMERPGSIREVTAGMFRGLAD